jgi:hypothetical protein
MVTKLNERGEMDDADLMDNYVTFLAGIFRSVRFGASSAHGVANTLRFNFFEQMGAFSRDEDSGTYRVEFAKMQEAVNALSAKILLLRDGDYEGASRFVDDGQDRPAAAGGPRSPRSRGHQLTWCSNRLVSGLANWTLLLLAQAMWAGSYVAMKVAGEAMPVGAVVVFRYALATFAYLFLIPFVGLPRLKKRDWALVAVLGVINFALTPTLQVEALRWTRAAESPCLLGWSDADGDLAGLILLSRSIRNHWGHGSGVGRRVDSVERRGDEATSNARGEFAVLGVL